MITIITDEVFGVTNYVDKYKIEDIFNTALKHLNQDEDLIVDLTFVDKEEIQSLNLNTRNIEKVTDVLSYPNLELKAGDIVTAEQFKSDVDFDSGSVLIGCIAICLDKVFEQAKEYNHSECREVSYLALHGLLHLLGYDHMQDDDKKIMREKEEEILSILNIQKD